MKSETDMDGFCSVNMQMSINLHGRPDNRPVWRNEWVAPGHLATISVRRILASQIICTFKKIKMFPIYMRILLQMAPL